MSTYLTQSFYYRQLEVAELPFAVQSGHGLLLIGADGSRTFVDQPQKYQPERWIHAAGEGRVFLVWAVRWGATDELPENTEPAEQGHAEPVEAHTDPAVSSSEVENPVTPAASELASTLQLP